MTQALFISKTMRAKKKTTRKKAAPKPKSLYVVGRMTSDRTEVELIDQMTSTWDQLGTDLKASSTDFRTGDIIYRLIPVSRINTGIQLTPIKNENKS